MTVPEGPRVQSMFAGISRRYDTANHALSGGMDWYWRARIVRSVVRRRPRHVADLATGTGDVAFALRRRLPPECRISALDFCEPMLAIARRKQERLSSAGSLQFSFGDCLRLPLADHSVDAATIAFGLRNLEDRSAGLREMHRILQPSSGSLHILEFTQPARWLHPFYSFYLHRILPVAARLLTGNRSAYEYLGGTIKAFPTKDALSHEITMAGFSSVKATGLTGSIVALHVAFP